MTHLRKMMLEELQRRHQRGSVRRASGFVLTSKPEITKAKAHEECCGRAGSQSVRPAGQWIAKAELAPFNCDLQLHLEYRE